MKIIKLKAENIKKLVAIEIEPDSNIVKITGKNGSGKTSILDSIWWALGGVTNVQEQPIRKGEKNAEITLDLGDIEVKRRFTAKGSTLKVLNKDGSVFQSPQSMLDSLVGRLSFDPLGFMRMDPKKQFNELRSIVDIPVDLDALDKNRKSIFDERTEVTREIKSLSSRIDAIDFPDDTPDEEFDGAEYLTQIEEGVKHNQKKEKAITEINSIQESIVSAEEEQNSIIKQIEELNKRKLHLDKEILTLAERKGKGEKYIKEFVGIDTDAIKSKLASLQTDNKNVRLKKDWKLLKDNLKTKESEYESLCEKIKDIDATKQSALENAMFPLPGLSFSNGEVIYNELPLDQSSAAEQLRVSVSIAMSANPKLKVIRITDGSLLDSESMKILEEMASVNDYQVWIESVDESGKVGVVIEEGKIKKA